jgi:hypothetical protein
LSSHCGALKKDLPKLAELTQNHETVVSPYSSIATIVFSCQSAFVLYDIRRMRMAIARQSVKIIGANGQISLGKQFAGRQVLVEEQGPGVWLVRTASVIPDNERWINEPDAASQLGKALVWTQANPPVDANVDQLLGELDGRD